MQLNQTGLRFCRYLVYQFNTEAVESSRSKALLFISHNYTFEPQMLFMYIFLHTTVILLAITTVQNRINGVTAQHLSQKFFLHRIYLIKTRVCWELIPLNRILLFLLIFGESLLLLLSTKAYSRKNSKSVASSQCFFM